MIELSRWEHAFNIELEVPGDKSLTHRGILMSALAMGDMELTGWLDAGDTRSSLRLVQALGVEIREETAGRLVLRRGPAVHEPEDVIDCGNSGTTMRLAAGLLAGLPGLSVLTGDASLRRRPMARVAEPLREGLGVRIWTKSDGRAPIAVLGGGHHGGRVALQVASAQVKSALLLAGVTAEEAVSVVEPQATRDHTERLIAAMGGSVAVQGRTITVMPSDLRGLSFQVPGDPSSAAFWFALAALQTGRRVAVRSLLFNPTRVGFLRVLEAMECRVEWSETGRVPEPYGAVAVSGLPRRPVAVSAEEVPSMVDEVPLVALLATQAPGRSVISGAEELRVKESDRIHVTATILEAMGAQIEERSDGWVIEGPTPLKGADVDAAGDHRMAMLTAIAATIAEGPTRIRGEESVAISYPAFFEGYQRIARIRP
jgi:3-phosphoshikimate 1-carboxyvinyltransferase